MLLDRLHGDAEAVGDLLIGQALFEQGTDLGFAGGQAGVGFHRGQAAELLQHTAEHQDVVARHPDHGAAQRGRIGVGVDEAAGAGGHPLAHLGLGGSRTVGDRDHTHRRIDGGHRVQQGRPGDPGQPGSGQHHRRVQQPQRLDGLIEIAHLGDHLDAGLARRQQPHQPGPHRRLGVDDQHSQPGAVRGTGAAIGQIGPHPRPPAGGGVDAHPAAHLAGSRHQPAQPDPARPAQFGVDIEAGTVVLDDHRDAVRAVDQPEPHHGRPGVLGGVGQRLADDPEQLVLDFGGDLLRLAELPEDRGEPRGGLQPLQVELQALGQRAASVTGRTQPPDRPTSLVQGLLGDPLRGQQGGGRVAAAAELLVGLAEVEHDRGQAASDRVVQLEHRAFPLGDHGVGPHPGRGLLVQPGIGHRDRGMGGEAREQVGVGLGEALLVRAGEDHQRADRRPPPQDGCADHGPPVARLVGCDVAASDLGVGVEDDRLAGLGDRSGDPLVEREDLAGLAALVEVDLLEIGVRDRVDQAERAAAAAQQLDRAAQDPFQQWLQPELAGEILGDRRERVRPGRLGWPRLIDFVHALPPRSDLASLRSPVRPGHAVPWRSQNTGRDLSTGSGNGATGSGNAG